MESNSETPRSSASPPIHALPPLSVLPLWLCHSSWLLHLFTQMILSGGWGVTPGGAPTAQPLTTFTSLPPRTRLVLQGGVAMLSGPYQLSSLSLHPCP